MGTYPTTPSTVLATGEDLQKHINANKEQLIGNPILTKFGADLPYLPKVRSLWICVREITQLKNI
jgi:mannose-6-phosphate isomerase